MEHTLLGQRLTTNRPEPVIASRSLLGTPKTAELDPTLPFASSSKPKNDELLFQQNLETWKKTQDPAKADELLNYLKPHINEAIRVHAGQSSPTIQSRAKILTLNALTRYDPTKSAPRTFLYNQLGGLRRFARRQSQAVSIPERIGLDRGRLAQATDEFRLDHGRDPADDELADLTGLSVKRIRHIRKYNSGLAQGALEAATSTEEGGALDPAVMDSKAHNAWLQFVYADLGPIDQKIMDHTLGLHGNKILPNHQLARVVGLSPGAVSQRKARIQNLIEQESFISPFGS